MLHWGMNSPSTDSPSRTELGAGFALLALALLSMGWILPNRYVQDDAGVISTNPMLHHWGALWKAFTVPYWPPVTSHELYRPLSSAGYAVQWMIGGGSAQLFRVVSLLLYAGTVLMVWRLLRRLGPPGAAWIGAALFAVHPVHVESVALAVNQSELVVAILLMLAVNWKIGADRGETPQSRASVLIWVVFTIGVFVKEHTLVLPGLLIAADLCLAPAGDPVGARWKRWRGTYAGLVVTGLLFWYIRGRVLGPGAGTDPAEALVGAGLLERSATMIGVAAEWLRLFLWPAHLQSDWNLLEWTPTVAWSLRETAGACAVIAFVAAGAAAWRRRPVAAFGLAWMAVALAPVSNVLIPSGIVLAERTLFLASVGFVIVLADLSALGDRWLERYEVRTRKLAQAGLVLLIGLGAVRSGIRTGDWRTRWMYLTTQMLDAPTSWRARIAYAMLLADIGDTAQARLEVRVTLGFRPDLPLAPKPIVDRLRLETGNCRGPVLAYDEMLALVPGRSDVRGSLTACLLFLGDYATARKVAEGGIALGLNADYFRYVVGVADSAARAGATAGTVRLRPIGNDATVVGTPRVDQ